MRKSSHHPYFQVDEEPEIPENPEHNLIEAIVERGIRDAVGTQYTDHHWIVDAQVWILSESEEDWSFKWSCKELQLSSKFIKRAILLTLRYRKENAPLQNTEFLTLPSDDREWTTYQYKRYGRRRVSPVRLKYHRSVQH